jgi:hypothetical protein
MIFPAVDGPLGSLTVYAGGAESFFFLKSTILKLD